MELTMAISGDSQERSMRAAVRDLVDRALRRKELTATHQPASPDFDWEPDDHAHVLAEDGETIDPWECEERPVGSIDLVRASDQAPAAEECQREERSDAECSRLGQEHENATFTCDETHWGLQQGLLVAEALFETEEFAASEVESESWGDLEEAEGDFLHVQDGMRIDIEGDAQTDICGAEEEPLDEAKAQFDGAEGKFDAGDAATVDVPFTDLDFDSSDDAAATSWSEALFEDSADDGFDIYDFDADARQTPWDFEPDLEEVVPRRAREKAAAVATLIDVVDRREQAHALAFLIALFEHLQHPATFRALYRAASEGLTLDLLKAMVALRYHWTERTEWWKGRYGIGFEVTMLQNGASALSWVQCARICRARQDHPPECMIDEEWLDDWLYLSHGEPGFLSFPAYIDVRVRSLEASHLPYGFGREACFKDFSDIDDAADRRRGHLGDDGALRFGLSPLKPVRRKSRLRFAIHESIGARAER
jgi:hypothetical protein